MRREKVKDEEMILHAPRGISVDDHKINHQNIEIVT